MKQGTFFIPILVGLWLGGAAAGTAGERQPTPEEARFFETRIRPLLANRCFPCHGPEKQKSGLRLDSPEAVRKGGSSGEALVVPGRPEGSLLIRAVRQHEGAPKMPPNGKLKGQDIADLVRWVQMGAPYPRTAAATARRHWAFQPPADPAVPSVRDTSWPQTPLDRFILAGLEAKGLRPAPRADGRTLIRRATFDLIGLPPTPDEVAAFLADDSPAAFARVVDRLLASPAYGERAGRHWLDVARYADSNGMDENLAMGHAWRYRDYVIASFNQDKPYDAFVTEQIAGDLLPVGDSDRAAERLTATGFLCVGPKMLAEDDPVKMEMDIIDEQLDTVGRTILGLTLGCARCHDHKFDPVTTADYYGLAGIFKSTRTMDHFKVVARWHERPIVTRDFVERQRHHERQLAALRAEIERASTGREYERLYHEQAARRETKPAPPEVMAVEDSTPTNLRIHLRGSHLTLGKEVPRRFPEALAGPAPVPVVGGQSGRLQLAEWLTRPGHPLTSRVMVNRLWRWHFGEGLVRSADNFGSLGDRPSHPELLDWLAVRFVERGWSVKAMHRLIMLSSTYQMCTAHDDRAARTDPDNRLHWRHNRRRLEAEALRDGILAVGGRLDRTMGGTLYPGGNRAYVIGYPNTTYDGYDFDRRSVYLPVMRSDVYAAFQAFDFPDPSVASGERATTTVAPQALFLMNSRLVREQARHLAAALLADPGSDDAGRVRVAYERAYARPPSAREVARALDFVRRCEEALANEKVDAKERRLRGWQSLCRVLLAANEFIYVE